MIDPARFIGALDDAGVGLYVGVPDSLMKTFSATLAAVMPPERHLITANEGNAVATAMGHTLATGRPALVYLQNSGLGNTVNPLLSLVDPEVYGIPMVLLIGWRGEPGVADEPQHVKQGRITPSMLDAMEIPLQELCADTDVTAVVGGAVEEAVRRGGPVAIIVHKGAFGPAPSTPEQATHEVADGEADDRPTREAALGRVVDAIPDGAVVVATTGMLSRELFELRAAGGGGDLDLLTVGGMGHASSIALGAALADPARDVWCLDGDGALLMHLGALPVISGTAGERFHHVVFNNRVHDSVGGQPTAIDRVDLPTLARAAGYRWSGTARALDSAGPLIAEVAGHGPALLEFEVRPGNRPDIGRPTRTPREARLRLQQALGLTAESTSDGPAR